MRLRLVAATLAMLASAACASGAPPHARPIGGLEARALARAGEPGGAPPETSTRAYRALARNSLGGRCRMFPSDSEIYDRHARRCGAATAAVRGISRLLLEVAASAELLRPVVVDGRPRWLDLPEADTCPR